MGRTYSVLLLRDDQQVRRFRFNPLWVRLLFYTFLLLALLAAGGVYLSLGYWEENKRLSLELQELRLEVQQQRVRLTSVQNMEQILRAHDPDELQALLSDYQTEPGITAPAPEVDLQDIFKRVDSAVCSVKDVELQELADGRMQLQFTLTNDLEGGKSISGFVEAAFVTRGGSLAEPLVPENDMSFHIQRFRTFETSFPLPDGLVMKDLYAFRLLVIAEDGEIVFSRAYPMQQVLSEKDS